MLFTGVEDGLGGNEGSWPPEVDRGGEWNNLLDGDRVPGEEDRLRGVDLKGGGPPDPPSLLECPLVELLRWGPFWWGWERFSNLEMGGEEVVVVVDDEVGEVAGRAGGMAWWTAGGVGLLK